MIAESEGWTSVRTNAAGGGVLRDRVSRLCAPSLRSLVSALSAADLLTLSRLLLRSCQPATPVAVRLRVPRRHVVNGERVIPSCTSGRATKQNVRRA